jgi:hypothetical protein
MRKGLGILATIACLAIPANIAAKAQDKVTDETRLSELAYKADILPFSAMPETGAVDVDLEVAPDIDRRVIAIGEFCKGSYRPKTTIALLASRYAQNWDADNNLILRAKDAPRITLRLLSAVATQRCFYVGEFEATCFIKASLEGEIETSDAKGSAIKTPLQSEVERELQPGILCVDFDDERGSIPLTTPNKGTLYAMFNNGQKGSIALISREAIIALIDKAKRKLSQAESANR